MKIRRKQREKRTHALQWVLLVVLAIACFAVYQGVQGVLHVVDEWTSDLPSLETTDAFNFAEESLMYAGDETTLLAEFQLEKREPVSVDQISPYVLEATVDTEDIRFYEHNGVDLPGIARALFNNLRGGELEGASTITQQLVRNTVLSQEATDITLERKVREAQLAIDLEKIYTKDEVLGLYLNTINYGDGCYGIEAAAQNYYQVPSLNLTLAQAATLVGIPQSPTNLNPKIYPDAALARRNVVLDRMLTAGDITQEEHDAAQAEPLALNPAPDVPEKGIYAYPYFTEYVRQQLMSEDNTFGVSNADLFEGGLTIYTSLDPVMQDKAEAVCAAQNDRMDSNLESSLVAIEAETGYVRALVGGKDFYTDEWNIATQGGQPTGSTFKAFTLTAAIEQGISPQTLIDCTSPMPRPNAEPLENFGGINYGIRTIQSATAVSSNTGYYRLAEQVTPAAMNEMAHRLGANFTELNMPSATLGTENVTPLDMAAAYSTLATGGVKHPPISVTRIVDKNGAVIYDAAADPNLQAERVITEEVAGATTKVLRTVFETGEGTANNAQLYSGQPVAGKTGTVMEFRGHWLVGYTPTLSCATWIGGRNYEQTSQYLTANALWQDFMNQALEDQPITSFPVTSDPPYGNAFNASQQQTLGGGTNTNTTTNNTDATTSGTGSLANAPSAVGSTLSQAASLLAGYNAGYIEEYSPGVPAGVVMGQTVQGDQIVLTVSKGPAPTG